MRSENLKFSTEKQRFNQAVFKVLSLVVNTRRQPWAPLIDGLVDDAVLQLSPDGDEALH